MPFLANKSLSSYFLTMQSVFDAKALPDWGYERKCTFMSLFDVIRRNITIKK